MNIKNVEYKNEIAEDRCIWSFTKCSKCGFETEEQGTSSTVCEDTHTAVEKAFTKSNIIKTWDDVLTKCHTVLCLNAVEYKAGLEETDILIEDTAEYHLIEEERYRDSLLLIVINDSIGNAVEEEKQLQKVLVAGNLRTIEELSNESKVCSKAVCAECPNCKS